MTKHPLTDEIVEKQFGRYDGIDEVMVYDEDDIRAAADWQLEQVTEWLKVELRRSSTFKGYSVIDNDNFFKDLEKAMRPEDNND